MAPAVSHLYSSRSSFERLALADGAGQGRRQRTAQHSAPACSDTSTLLCTGPPAGDAAAPGTDCYVAFFLAPCHACSREYLGIHEANCLLDHPLERYYQEHLARPCTTAPAACRRRWAFAAAGAAATVAYTSETHQLRYRVPNCRQAGVRVTNT